jgi:hypothetical protein
VWKFWVASSPGEFNHQTRRLSADGDHAMERNSTATPEASLFDGAAWFDPIEAGVRDRIRGFIETMLEEELGTSINLMV